MPKLPSDLEHIWQDYLLLESKGLRQKALKILDEFVAKVNELEVNLRFQWVDEFLRQKLDSEIDLPLRRPLWREVVFPRLEAGFRAKEFRSTLRLAELSRELCRDDESWMKIGRLTERGLLLIARELDPQDELTRKKLCKVILNWIRYTLHELPSGVLYGNDGATEEQCRELQTELHHLKELLRANEQTLYAELLDDAAFHYAAYPEYLSKHEQFESYADFLKARDRGW